MTRLDPFFSYYGAGFRKCRRGFYPPPRDGDLIVERFAGSAAYACTFGAGRDVLLVDIDPVICSVWSWLIQATPADVLALPVRWPEDKAVNEIGLEPGAANLIGFWLNAASTRPRQRPSSWMRSGIRPRSFWGQHKRELLARQVLAIKRWRVLRRTYGAALGVTSVWFPSSKSCTVVDDPPYREAGKHYAHAPHRGNAGYPADSRDVDAWYRRLAADEDALACEGHQVIVWEQEGADWRPDFEPCGVVKALEGRNGKKTSREARAVLNGPEGWPS